MVGKKHFLESVPGGYSRHKEHHKRTKTANVISPGITNEWQHRMQRLHWELKAAEKGKAQLINKEVIGNYSVKSSYKSQGYYNQQKPMGGCEGATKIDFYRFRWGRVQQSRQKNQSLCSSDNKIVQDKLAELHWFHLNTTDLHTSQESFPVLLCTPVSNWSVGFNRQPCWNNLHLQQRHCIFRIKNGLQQA